MSMAREQNLDVREPEAQPFDVCANDGNGPFETRIDQDVAVGGCHQITREPFGPDVVEMVRNAMRREWVIPIALGAKRAACDDG
jgi:hypothetical protein